MRFNIKARASSLFHPGEGLYQRTVRSGAWALALRITERVFGIIRLIILARILAPNDFGLLGIALLAMMTLETFSRTGFQQALIQKKGNIRNYLNAAWTVSALRGLILFAVLFLVAPYVAIFFDAPVATPLIRVVGVAAFLQGLTNIGVIYFRKELEFNKQFIYRASGTLADFVVAVSAALILRSVWALVFGLLAGAIVRLIVSYFIHPYRPRLSSHLGKTKELFGFGRWILGTSIITFLFNQGDDGFLGKVLGVTALGFYQIAYRIGQVPATEFAKVISRVTFPAYSKVQDELSKLREGFLKTLNITVIFMIPLAGGIFMLSPEFTAIFLGGKWMPMIPALRILVIAGMIRALFTTGGALFQGKGAPNIDFKMNLVRLLAMAITIYPLTSFLDMRGVALAVALGNVACIPIWFTETVKILKASFKDYFRIILPPFLGTLSMCLLLLLLKWALRVNLPNFILMVILAVGVYSAFMYLLDKRFDIKVLDELKSLIHSLAGA